MHSLSIFFTYQSIETDLLIDYPIDYSMQLDRYHKKILEALGQYGESSFNSLSKTLDMAKETFKKKLYELVKSKFVKRDPPSEKPTPHKGKPVKFRLTKKGERIDRGLTILNEFEKDLQENILEKLLDHSVERGERKPLFGTTAIYISQNSPICTIAHFPSRDQYEKLRMKLAKREARRELGILINHVVESYTENGSGGAYGSEYLSDKDAVFFMGFLPTEQTRMIENLVHDGLFENEYMVTRSLATFILSQITSIYKKFEESKRFREGKEGIVLTSKWYYNPENLSLEPMSRSQK